MRTRVLLALTLLAALVLTWLWIERIAVAERFAEPELKHRNVAARYDIVRIGPRTQRIENLVLGDPANPDLEAKWVEVDLGLTLSGVTVRAVRARGVRLKGQLVDGRLGFGVLDRFLPAPTDAPFKLPDIRVDLADARMRLATPYGMLGLAVRGKGHLQYDFRGQVAAAMPGYQQEGCRARRVVLQGGLAVDGGRPEFSGPLTFEAASCGGIAVKDANAGVSVRLDETFRVWTGSVKAKIGQISSAGVTLDRLEGGIGFEGVLSRLTGNLDLKAARMNGPLVVAGETSVEGPYEAGRASDGNLFATSNGSLVAQALVPGEGLLAPVAGLGKRGSGTPAGPILEALAQAVSGLSRGSEVRGRYALAHRSGSGSLRLSGLSASSASGARLAVQGESPVLVRWPGGIEMAGRAMISGGGFPAGDIRFAGDGGTAVFAPLIAGPSRLALAPVQFKFGQQGLLLDTKATLDGPLGAGRVEGLSVPVAFRPGRNPLSGCIPVEYRRLDLAGLRLAPGQFDACIADNAVRLANPQLKGRLGSAPIALEAARAAFGMARGDFTIDRLGVRLGSRDTVSLLDVGRFSGTLGRGGANGRFAGTSGRIGNVPILVSGGAGEWRLNRGLVTLGGIMTVSDAAPKPRYEPLITRDFVLKLADGRITATGTARHPGTDIAIANVSIRHDLSPGTGQAILDIPGLTFGKALQPEQLTGITKGVIANVKGTMAGRGLIEWTPQGVKSSGGFHTQSMDMAAAFGPIDGLSGEISLSDLLGLETAPGQKVRIAGINPGILVTDGEIRYRLLPGLRAQIEGGEWPFAGGKLILEPSVLDLNESAVRYLTFRVEGLDAARFIAAMEFENLAAKGIFDGVLPMVFDKAGGRIEGGRLDARGGGTLSYIGEISSENIGAMGQFAFEALKSIKYDAMSIDLNGDLDGDVITRVRFEGVNQAPITGVRPKFPLPIKIRGVSNVAFIFNVTITAKFRQLFQMARAFNDPSILINRALPQLEPASDKPVTKSEFSVQPAESDKKP